MLFYELGLSYILKSTLLSPLYIAKKGKRKKNREVSVEKVLTQLSNVDAQSGSFAQKYRNNFAKLRIIWKRETTIVNKQSTHYQKD